MLERWKFLGWDYLDSCLESGVDDRLDTGELRLLLYSSDLKNPPNSCHPVNLQIRTSRTLASDLRGSVPLATVRDPSSDMFSYYSETAEVITAHIGNEIWKMHKLLGICSDVDETGLE